MHDEPYHGRIAMKRKTIMSVFKLVRRNCRGRWPGGRRRPVKGLLLKQISIQRPALDDFAAAQRFQRTIVVTDSAQGFFRVLAQKRRARSDAGLYA